MILPHFDYCSPDWDNCSKLSFIDKLQKMQSRAARVITGRSYEIRSIDVLKELDWQPLTNRRKLNKAMCMFMPKVKKNELAEPKTNMFSISNNLNYNLRSNEINFDLPKPKTNFSKKV